MAKYWFGCIWLQSFKSQAGSSVQQNEACYEVGLLQMFESASRLHHMTQWDEGASVPVLGEC